VSQRSMLLVLTVLSLALGCASGPSTTDEWVSVVSGTWGLASGEATCQNNPHEISFSSDRLHMNVELRSPIQSGIGTTESKFRYRILGARPSELRMELEGETRTTDDGKLVIWDLRMRGQDEYCWHRTDWPYRACTARSVRCP
jgi:hypothetical protein